MELRICLQLAQETPFVRYAQALQNIACYNDVSFAQLLEKTGMTPDSLDRALALGDGDIPGYDTIAQALGCKNLAKALEFSDYILRYGMVHHEAFGKILCAWRNKRRCSAAELAAGIGPDLSPANAEAKRIHVERDTITPEEVAATLKTLGLESVYDLIERARLEDVYPRPQDILRPVGFPDRTPIALMQPGAVFRKAVRAKKSDVPRIR